MTVDAWSSPLGSNAVKRIPRGAASRAAAARAPVPESLMTALTRPTDGERPRVVTLLTDGYIGNEEEIFAAVKKHLDKHTHLFSFGVGSRPLTNATLRPITSASRRMRRWPSRSVVSSVA